MMDPWRPRERVYLPQLSSGSGTQRRYPSVEQKVDSSPGGVTSNEWINDWPKKIVYETMPRLISASFQSGAVLWAQERLFTILSY